MDHLKLKKMMRKQDQWTWNEGIWAHFSVTRRRTTPAPRGLCYGDAVGAGWRIPRGGDIMQDAGRPGDLANTSSSAGVGNREENGRQQRRQRQAAGWPLPQEKRYRQRTQPSEPSHVLKGTTTTPPNDLPGP